MTQTNDTIYALINSLRLELKQDIATQGIALGTQMGKIEKKLEDLEVGRITPIEKDVSDLKISSATGNVKLGVLVFIGSSIISSVVTVMVARIAI